MKKQRDEEAADCGESANTFHRPSENVFFSFKAATAAEMWRKILEQASPDDIMGEYIWFLKNLPKLLNNVESDLIEEVKTELGIANLKLSGKVNFKGSNYPILDALSCKMGKSLRHILAPPTTSCLLCGKVLIANHKPSQVPLHSLNGPGIASKYAWECRGCCGAAQFRVGQAVPGCFKFLKSSSFSLGLKSFYFKNIRKNTVLLFPSDDLFITNTRIYYQVDMYGNPEIGYKVYPNEMGGKVFRASSEVYLTERFLKSCQLRCHIFLFSKSELRQLRNYANYGGIFLAEKILNYANYVITPVTVAHFLREKF